MNSQKTKFFFKVFFAALALVFVLIIHGAIPFLQIPTSAQAFWSTGFSISFINDSVFSIYAKNFGFPKPAFISFGLSGVYPMGLFIAAGLHPADAYSLMIALFLSLSFFGAFKLSSLLGLKFEPAILAAVLWTSMPVIWMQSIFSMLSIGIALLSFYFFVSIKTFLYPPQNAAKAAAIFGMYLFSCVLAVFMDGYSFMMFLVGSSLLAVIIFCLSAGQRKNILMWSFPIHCFSFVAAYFLYSKYIGKSEFDPSSLDAFRAWGLDLSFLLKPTAGILFFWDAIKFSIPRSDKQFFGDDTTHISTFCLPLILTSIWFSIKMHAPKIRWGFILIALVGFYFALGPSVKYNSIKSQTMQAEDPITTYLMPEEYALAPSGMAWILQNVPGFRNMRAIYRWSALGVLGLWLIIVVSMADKSISPRILRYFLLILIVMNLPHLYEKWTEHANFREMFFKIDSDLVEPLKKDLHPKDKVAFLPYRNDFLVNYIAALTKIRTYNIGGDKNLREAQSFWPASMKKFQCDGIHAGFDTDVIALLKNGDADVVIFPFIDMLWAAHSWPTSLEPKEELAPIIEMLSQSGEVKILERQYYAVVKRSLPSTSRTY